MRNAVLTWACVVSAAAAGRAEPPAWTKQVAADAKWVVRVDVKSLVGSALGKSVLERMTLQRQLDLASFAETFGFDPTQDLDSVVLYGPDYSRTGGAAVFQGRFDQEKLLGLLAASEGHEEYQVGDRVLHRWKQKPQGPKDDGVRYGAFHGEGVVVICRARGPLESALKVLDGKTAALADEGTAALAQRLSTVPEGTFLQAAAVDFRLPPDAPRKGMFLRNTRAATLLLGESQGTASARLSATARDDETARKMRQVFQGFVALAGLELDRAAQNGRPAATWAKLIEDGSVGGEGAVVTAKLDIPVKELLELAEEAKAAKAEAHERTEH